MGKAPLVTALSTPAELAGVSPGTTYANAKARVTFTMGPDGTGVSMMEDMCGAIETTVERGGSTVVVHSAVIAAAHSNRAEFEAAQDELEARGFAVADNPGQQIATISWP
jgi:hypothetical protein